MGLREWFNSLSPIQQDIFLALVAGAYGVAVTWGLVEYFRKGDREPLQFVAIATALTGLAITFEVSR